MIRQESQLVFRCTLDSGLFFACGNEGGEGDIEMLLYSQGGSYPSFQLLINHDDAEREYAYSEKTNASINAAKKNKWTIVSIKNDWKQVFPQN